MRIPERLRIPSVLALLTTLALLGPDLSSTGTAFAQSSSFGKVELERPKDRKEWASLLHRNLLRQIKVGRVKEGTPPHQVIAILTVKPEGEITDVRLERASAYPTVNQAVLRVIRNAQKQPPFTPDMPQRPLEFRLPVNIKP